MIARTAEGISNLLRKCAVLLMPFLWVASRLSAFRARLLLRRLLSLSQPPSKQQEDREEGTGGIHTSSATSLIIEGTLRREESHSEPSLRKQHENGRG